MNRPDDPGRASAVEAKSTMDNMIALAIVDRSAALAAVTFPDAGTITGTTFGDGVIQWSNGSVWRKVYTGQMVADVSGDWVDAVSAQHITDTDGYLRVTFRNGRPTGIGYAVDASTIQVTFPDDATYPGTVAVNPSGYLHWSNNTT